MATITNEPILAADRAAPYKSIQYLRAIAAMLVVIHHSRLNVLFNPLEPYHFGAAGVDIFFVISGFIMYTAARGETAIEFARRRIIRIVPLYWLATILWLCLNIIERHAFSFRHIILSLLFIVHRNSDRPGFFPYLDAGWTLNYEMFFYLIFAIGLAVRRPVAVALVMTILAAAAGPVINLHGNVLNFYANHRMLEFAAGILVGMAAQRFSLRGLAVLLPIGFLGLIFSDYLFGSENDIVGFPAVMMVLGGVSMEKNHNLPSIPLLHRIGDASYSLYLVHVFVIAALAFVWRHLPLGGWLQYGSFLAALLILAPIVANGTFQFIERPVTRFLMRKTAGTRRSASVKVLEKTA